MKHVRDHVAKHEARQGGQKIMRETFSHWAGWRRSEGLTDREIYRKFYVSFGVDYLTAMTHDETKALDLTARMIDTMTTTSI